MLSSKLQHLPVNFARSNHRALDSETVCNQGHVGNAEVALGDAEWEDDGSGAQDGDDEIPICDLMLAYVDTSTFQCKMLYLPGCALVVTNKQST